MTKFTLLPLEGMPILEQLLLEEALLRADDRNFLLLNRGAPPSIVMGISGKPEKLVNLAQVHQDKIPLIKRFSGGGTVYIDPSTFFVTFICNQADLDVAAQPQPILRWAQTHFQKLFPNCQLRENDFVFGNLKFGGNAQYIQKGRWLLHTSFLWDYHTEKMSYLKLPEKRPEYRQNRPHHEFLCSLKSHFPQIKGLYEATQDYLTSTFSTEKSSLAAIAPILQRPHRKATTLVDLQGIPLENHSPGK